MDLYALLCLILGLPIGLLLFYLLNKVFDVYYFGCAGVWSTFFGCLIAGACIIFLLFEFIGAFVIPISIIALIIWFTKRKKKEE